MSGRVCGSGALAAIASASKTDRPEGGPPTEQGPREAGMRPTAIAAAARSCGSGALAAIASASETDRPEGGPPTEAAK